MTKQFVLIISLTLFVLFGFLAYLFRNELILETHYYPIDHQKEVNSYNEIDAVFASLPKKAYLQLDASYLSKTKSSKFKYKRLLKRKEYYVVHKKDLFKKIAGDVRIKDLLPQKDQFYKNGIYEDSLAYSISKQDFINHHYWNNFHKIVLSKMNYQIKSNIYL